MAALVVPISAISFKESEKSLKSARYHILNPHNGFTVCNYIPFNRVHYTFSVISSLRARQLCNDCLGAAVVKEDKDTKMAKIYTPHRAIGIKGLTKYHLMKNDGDPVAKEGGLTVCNLVIKSDQDLKELFGCGDRSEIYDCPVITSLPAEQLCKACLGPLKAVED